MAMAYIPVEKIPRIVFLAKALSGVPSDIRIVKDGRISFIGIVRYLKKRDPSLYNNMLKVYGCGSESCLARALSQTLYWLYSHISFDRLPERTGELYNVIRGIGDVHPSVILG